MLFFYRIIHLSKNYRARIGFNELVQKQSTVYGIAIPENALLSQVRLTRNICIGILAFKVNYQILSHSFIVHHPVEEAFYSDQIVVTTLDAQV